MPPLPAFPGAEGAGVNTLGGRGGDVYYVTNLADSGAGSLRDAIATTPARRPHDRSSESPAPSSWPRRLPVNKPRLTIAGQTAPGGGICLKNYALRVDADDVVVRHIRSRLGTDAAQEDDAITVWGGINVMLDHCSASWSVDEVLSVHRRLGQRDRRNGATSPRRSTTRSTARGRTASARSLVTNCPAPIRVAPQPLRPQPKPQPASRQLQRQRRSSFDFRNNVIYDWGFFAGLQRGEPGGDRHELRRQLSRQRPGLDDRLGLPRRRHHDPHSPNRQPHRPEQERRRSTARTPAGACSAAPTTRRPRAFDFSQTEHDRARRTGPATRALASRRPAVGPRLARTRPWRRTSWRDRRVRRYHRRGRRLSGPGRRQPPRSTPTTTACRITGNPPPAAISAVADNNSDADGDGYTNLEEYLNWLRRPHAVTPDGPRRGCRSGRRCNGGRTGLDLHGGTPRSNGSVVLLADGHTARFTPTAGFKGLGELHLQFHRLRPDLHPVRRGGGVSSGPPGDLRGSEPRDLGHRGPPRISAAGAAARPLTMATRDLRQSRHRPPASA